MAATARWLAGVLHPLVDQHHVLGPNVLQLLEGTNGGRKLKGTGVIASQQ
jgi:hypothetical protein